MSQAIRHDDFYLGRLDLHEAVIFLGLTFLVASVLDTNWIKLPFSLYLIFLANQRVPGILFHRFNLTLIGLFMWGGACTIFYLLRYDVDANYFQWIFNRTVLIALHVIFAVGVFTYLVTQSYGYIKNVFFYGAAMNLGYGVIELLFLMESDGGGRLRMLAFEPSMAAAFYCCAFAILLGQSANNRLINAVGKAYVVMGLLIRSKAQWVAMALTVTTVLPTFLIVLLLTAIYLVAERQTVLFLLSSLEERYTTSLLLEQIFFVLRDLDNLIAKGLFEFIYFNELGKSSWVIRLSAIHMGFYNILDNFWGAGWGTFNHFFTHKMDSLGYVISTVNSVGGDGLGNEASEIYEGVQEATPKSFLLEFLGGAGILGFYVIYRLIQSVKKNCPDIVGLKYGLYGLIFISLLVESAPVLALFALLYAWVCVASKYNAEIR